MSSTTHLVQVFDSTVPRAPLSAAGVKGGQQGQAPGRSQGGSTKIHLKTDFDGLPITFDLTGGGAADSPHFETLMDIGPDVRPRAIVADKGYDSAGNRQLARKKGALRYEKTATNFSSLVALAAAFILIKSVHGT